MKRLMRALACGSMMLVSCGVARNAAVTSYQVATAPVRLVARQFEDSPPADTATTSDVDVPGHPVAASSPKPRVVAQDGSSQKPTRTQTAVVKSKSPASSGTAAPVQFPVAKPVPGKPGYVFSPYDASKYVDVSGYTPGSKVKDPYAQKIFIVP